jgi:hypothetical protein
MRTSKVSRIEALKIYSRRMARWRSNSSPFLSGDLFSDLADFSFNQPKWRREKFNFHRLKNAQVIFCPSMNLTEFLAEYGKYISAKILIAGNDDTEFHTPLSNLPNSIKHVYLQNSFISDNKKIFTLPIGIENFRYGVNGNPKFMNPLNNQVKKDKILFGPFSNTHPDRVKIIEMLSKEQGPWEILFERLSVTQYRNIVSNFKLVGALRGNGIDTHRAWESLYRGIVPVVEKNLWSDSLWYLELPILTVTEWKPENLISLVNQKKVIEVKPNKLESLWVNWWIERFRKVIS